MGADVTIWLALGAGLLSFLSPCTLPIFPAYLSYVTGMTVKDIQEGQNFKVKTKLLSHSVFFLLGVSMIFLGLGLGASVVGNWIQGMMTGSTGMFIQRIAGVFILMMGLFIAGVFDFKWLMKEKRLSVKRRKSLGYAGTTFIGMGFAAGWTPCIGPIFASILVLAASSPAQGFMYSLFYVIGFAIPFLLATLFIGSTRWVVKYSGVFMKVGGSLMVGFGILLYTGQWARLSGLLLRAVDNTWLSDLGMLIIY